MSDNGTVPTEVPVAVPVPATGWLLLASLVGLAANRRKLG